VRKARQQAVVVARMRIVVTAEEAGISAATRRWECARSTVQRLVRRFREGGPEALCNQLRGPRGGIGEEVRELIVALKLAHLSRSCEKIRRLLEELGYVVHRQTVWRVLSERGLARVQESEPLRRFQHSQPNDLWQLDVMEDEPVRFGKVHLVAALDDHSRFCVGAQFVRRKGEAEILGALAGFLKRWGLPKALLTDRSVIFWGGSGDLARGMSTYQLALGSLGVRAAFAAPYKPRTKGKIERFLSFLQRDFLAEQSAQVRDLEHLNRELAGWLEGYNHRRPHASLREGVIWPRKNGHRTELSQS